MQRLRDLSRLVEAVFNELSESFGEYQKRRGLDCVSGCGACCNNPAIEATPLEMLPLALRLYDEGRAEQVFAELEIYSGFACYHFQRASLDGSQGQCGVYQERPAICRMFGAAGYGGKDGKIQISTCKPIKATHPQQYADSLIAMESDPPPMLRHGKERVKQLDYDLGKQDMPINQALKYVLEKVMMQAYFFGADDPHGWDDGSRVA
ncbi:YkgJ family cysteine cluster protein [Aliiglaciecola sp. CAU 1673]|uniref:YkgJ family cysteine cluster protein n=1 Tax=Aliiglaciecola sp. CAU 1673 TaxID=3032595 RepID=UPI0023DC4B36|nr:YkgJ family cysteine cluster protein [Aliiglaciecola sp. CAU 1673]MDF2179671.1 YkgJ family cysteine cluster protein [Aliiglaciecola sp. CAU 1673]